MGMIWNSAATKLMVDTLNFEFSNNIAKWQAIRDVFDHRNAGNNHELKKIASDNGLYGGGVAGSDADDRWQIWLGVLGKSFDTPNSNHEKLRKALYDGLDAAKYDAIYFQVVPRPHSGNIKIATYPDADDRIMGILVETPTIDAVKKAIKAKAQRRKKAKAKKKL